MPLDISPFKISSEYKIPVNDSEFLFFVFLPISTSLSKQKTLCSMYDICHESRQSNPSSININQ